MKLIAISGSLRAESSNTAVLRAAARLAPSNVSIIMFDGIADLPFFNPDLDGDSPPEPVLCSSRPLNTLTGFQAS